MLQIAMTTDIQEFFADKTVFITGATGFVGKLLVEKLLRTCNVKKIYITVRPKKTKNIYQRLDEYFEDVLFNRLKNERGNVTKQIEVVSADLALPNLGMSDSDRKIISEEVNVVFHTAATIRFDEALRTATYINVRGTEAVLRLCGDIHNLVSVVYVSTAYSFCVRSTVDEAFYKPAINSFDLLAIVDSASDTILDAITPLILSNCPNTYVLTKSVAEDVVQRNSYNLPISMVRPSIIIGTATDPVPGWVDNYTGATGVFVGAGLGLIRTLNCRLNFVADLIPADYVVNCLIAASAKACKRQNSGEKNDIPIYNCVTSSQNSLTWKDCLTTGLRNAESVPTALAIWSFFLIPCSNRYIYLILHYLLHVIPAYITDFCAVCVGKKPQLVKGYKKIKKFMDVLAYFGTRQWTFINTNTQKLYQDLGEEDKMLFQFDVAALNWDTFFYDFVRGIRVYLLKDPLDTIPQGRAKQLKLKIAHYTLLCFLIMLFFQFMCIFL